MGQVERVRVRVRVRFRVSQWHASSWVRLRAIRVKIMVINARWCLRNLEQTKYGSHEVYMRVTGGSQGGSHEGYTRVTLGLQWGYIRVSGEPGTDDVRRW